MADNRPPPSQQSSSKPPATITLPPRNSIESLFTEWPVASPAPMALVSSFFAENDSANDCRSFSQLLAGAMSPPVDDGRIVSGDLRFQQNRSSVFHPPELSPASLFDSTDLFSSSQVQFGMSRQQILAPITDQHHVQNPSFSSAPGSSLSQFRPLPSNASLQQHVPPPLLEPKIIKELSDFSQSDQKFQPPSITVDKPIDDGYNWRKYGQKQVKGSEFPRSYYKCTHPNCPVKKKVERSLDGQITEIMYKSHHNHPKPSPYIRDTVSANGTMNPSEFVADNASGKLNKPEEKGPYLSNAQGQGQGSSQLTLEQISGSSDSEEVADDGNGYENEPESKRRNIEVLNPEQASSHHMVTEPRIIVQTTSEVDILDDGYKWRKYGQKLVKGNPYPRSYYRCTNAGCNVRKHVERAASDRKAVITSYEGKHKHDVPAGKKSSPNASAQFRGMEYGNEQQAVALRFKGRIR